ncbi:unnamed protein product, partial [Sphagnum balticum]
HAHNAHESFEDKNVKCLKQKKCRNNTSLQTQCWTKCVFFTCLGSLFSKVDIFSMSEELSTKELTTWFPTIFFQP